MADDKDSNEEPVKIFCNYCKKPTFRKYIKCDNCDKVYHNSCADRITCCGTKNDKQYSQKIINLEAYEEERKALLLSNEQLKTQNNNLLEENQKLRTNILTLESKIKNGFSDNQSSCNGNKEDIKFFIKTEINKELLSVKKEMQTLKLKFLGLESANKNNTVEKTQEVKIKSTKTNATLQTKQTNDIQPVDTKQVAQTRNIETLENKQKQIMNRIINLNADGKSTDVTTNRSPIEDQQSKDAETGNEGFTSVLHKTRRKFNSNKGKNTTIIGRASDKSTGKLQGAIRRQWFYVGHIINKEATVEDMENYLVENLDNTEGSMFSCMKLNTLGSCSAFKVGIPCKYVDRVKDPEFWSEGVVFKDYKFSKKPNNISSNNENPNFPREVASYQNV